MLFDLRGRGRRRTVQAVYLGLAILIGGGLVLFGVGTGSGGGGLLNGIPSSGGGGSNALSQQDQAALNAVKAHPDSASAWSQLVQARYQTAGQGNNFNASTNTFTASGKRELASAVQAWQHYLQLTKSPDPSLAMQIARAYDGLGNYAGEASAWEVETAAQPNVLLGFECLSASAFAAGETDKAELALNKSLTMVPKAQQATVKADITAAKTNPAIIRQECYASTA